MVIVLLLLQFSSLRRILTLSFSRPSRVGFVIVTNVWLMVVFSVFTPVKQHSSSLMAQAFPGDEPCGLSLLSVVFKYNDIWSNDMILTWVGETFEVVKMEHED